MEKGRAKRVKIKKIIKYTLIAVPLLFLAKYSIESSIYNSNKTPVINPHPKEKLRVYGKFPLDPQKYYIQTSVHYFASNSKCDTHHWLAGASSRQEEFQEFNTTMLDNGYEVIVYDDFYKRGVCDWEIENIILSIVSEDQVSYVVFFTVNNITQMIDNKIQSTKPINFICNYDYNATTENTRYFCKDTTQNIVTGRKVITVSDIPKQFEINFQQIAEPVKTINYITK